MKNLNIANIKLKSKIFGISLFIIVSTLTVLGYTIYSTQKKQIEKEVNATIVNHLNDLKTILEDHVNLKQSAVNISMNLAGNILNSYGSITELNETLIVKGVNQLTQKQADYNIKIWTIGDDRIFNSTTIVDDIKQQSVETATIFQKISDGYLRISTNVMKKDGQRAVGTFIPNTSEVVKTIEKGQTYSGRALVVGEWYLTSYKPIRINGEIKGILYVGIKEKNYDFLKSVFSGKVYYESGYPYIVNKSGDCVIHPTLEGKNLSENQFFKQLLNAGPNDYKTNYRWPDDKNGDWHRQYFKYFEPYDCYICITVAEKDLEKATSKLLLIVSLSIISTIVLLAGALALILNPIIRKLKEATAFAQTIASGDLRTSIDIKQEDEIGHLVHALQTMQQRLKEIVTEITIGSESILNASKQLNESSQIVSEGASEQAASVEEISSTIEQFGANIQQNTENSNQTKEITIKASDGIIRSNNLAEVAKDSIKKIASKITVIHEIAQQTNILALNASVESARAGNEGRGFQVVALEVRKLAERSKLAADEIARLTLHGVDSTEKASRQLSDIIPSMDITKNLVNEITNSSFEMSSGSIQVNSSVQQLNLLTQKNAAASEEMSGNAEELANQALKLKNSVTFFKI